jgi:hypothetical protein
VNKNNLHIGCWNINGHKHKGFDKYSDKRFINEIKEKGIIYENTQIIIILLLHPRKTAVSV